MFIISNKTSRIWTRMEFHWGEVFCYGELPKWADQADSIDVIEEPGDFIETWPGEKTEVHVNKKNEIFVYHIKPGFGYIQEQGDWEKVIRFPAEWLNLTMLNIIEFQLGWDNRQEFAEMIDMFIKVGIPADHKGKSGWWMKRDDRGILFHHTKKPVKGFAPILQEHIQLFKVAPEQQVEFSYDQGVKLLLVDLDKSNDLYHGKDTHYLFVAPVSALTPRIISDTIHNLVPGDKKNWGNRVITLCGDDELIMNQEDAISCYRYHPSVSNTPLPSF